MPVETLLSVSSVYLFGRTIYDVQLVRNYTDDGLKRTGANRFLQNQLQHIVPPQNPPVPQEESCLARIYAFSFEGGLYELARPAIFLVHGAGFDPDDPPAKNVDGLVEYKRLARSPGSTALTGLGLQTGAFSLEMKVWVYDKGDFSLRMDLETGTFEQILLMAELAGDGRGMGGGAMARSSGARSSGAMARSSGAMARSSGWMARKLGDIE